MRKIKGIASLLLCGVLLAGCASQGRQGKDTAEAAGEMAKEVLDAGQEEGMNVGQEDEMEASQEKADGSASSGQEDLDIKGEEENGEALTEGEEKEELAPQTEAELPDGVYMANFQTDSSMFRVSEACDGKGRLTVEGGEMMIHISLGSKKIVNLYPGLAEDAQKEGAKLLSPTEDTVTYSDGMTEEVYGFDVPVPALEEEFDLALIGTKGKWYDHKVSVSEPVLLEESDAAAGLADGSYTVELTFEGGSGKAQILSPASICVTNGQAVATVQWNSPNYDYMIVDGEKYLPISTEGGSVFEIPVLAFDEPMEVIGDTVAMSKPHEVEYKIMFLSDTVK